MQQNTERKGQGKLSPIQSSMGEDAKSATGSYLLKSALFDSKYHKFVENSMYLS